MSSSSALEKIATDGTVVDGASAEVLESTLQVDTVLLDKTGTVATGAMTVP